MAQIKLILRSAVLMCIPYNFIWGFKKYLNINYLYFGKAQKNIGKYLHEKKTLTSGFEKDGFGKKTSIGSEECWG